MNEMKYSAFILIALLLLVSCSESEDTVAPVTEEPFQSQTVRLNYDETVVIDSADLTIKFDDLLYDSRCPANVYCFWAGQARISVLMSHPDRGVAVIAPAKRGGDTLWTMKLAGVALGYVVELIHIEPYPMDVASPPEPEEYVVKLRVSSADNVVQHYPPVIPTTLPPDSVQIDDYWLDSLSLSGDILTTYLHYSGGCHLHTYDLYWTPNSFMESEPVQVNLYLSHNGYNDPCDAIIGESPSFDISRIRSSYISAYGSPEEILLNVYDYYDDEPDYKVSILYEF